MKIQKLLGDDNVYTIAIDGFYINITPVDHVSKSYTVSVSITELFPGTLLPDVSISRERIPDPNASGGSSSD